MTDQERAWAEEHRDIVPSVYWRHFAHLGQHLCDDLQGEGYISLCEGVTVWDGRGRLGPWLYQRVRWAMANRIRDLVRRPPPTSYDAFRRGRDGVADHERVPAALRPIETCLGCGRTDRPVYAKGLCKSCDRARHRAKSRYGGEGVCRACASVIRSRKNRPACRCPEGPALEVAA